MERRRHRDRGPYAAREALDVEPGGERHPGGECQPHVEAAARVADQVCDVLRTAQRLRQRLDDAGRPSRQGRGRLGLDDVDLETPARVRGQERDDVLEVTELTEAREAEEAGDEVDVLGRPPAPRARATVSPGMPTLWM